MKLTEAVGKRLNELLAERNITQYRLSKKGGIPRPTVLTVVNAKNKTVNLDTVYQIAATLDMGLKEFFDSPLFDDLED